MIIVNYYQDEDYNPETDGYLLQLAGVINDTLDLNEDPQRIRDCIDNQLMYEPKNGVMYELQLLRASIASSFPASEPAFVLDKVITKKYNDDYGHHTPIVRI